MIKYANVKNSDFQGESYNQACKVSRGMWRFWLEISLVGISGPPLTGHSSTFVLTSLKWVMQYLMFRILRTLIFLLSSSYPAHLY